MRLTAQPLPGSAFPVLAQPCQIPARRPSTIELSQWISSSRGWIEEELDKFGALLIRGFDVSRVEDFSSIASLLLDELKPYVEGQSPRTKLDRGVYTSTEHPAKYRIAIHNELSYTKHPPKRLVFCCCVAAAEGGETPITDGRKVHQAMDRELLKKFEAKQVKYVKNMHGNTHGLGCSWMQHFETSDRDQVEHYLQCNDLDFEWKADGGLRTMAIRPATVTHERTGEKVWFNQANLWHVSNLGTNRARQLVETCGEENLPTHAFFGDGSPISDDELDAVSETLWDQAVSFRWQVGDVLLVDNVLVGHGRNAFLGDRKILVAMN